MRAADCKIPVKVHGTFAGLETPTERPGFCDFVTEVIFLLVYDKATSKRYYQR